jgi:Domain of unknown function (DUF4185)/Peptidase_C39 like family
MNQGLGKEKITEFWCSENLVDWERTDPFIQLRHPGHPGNIMLSFDADEDYVYIIGTGGLARDRPIWLWRNKIDDFPHGRWEPWGRMGDVWEWGNSNEHSPILPGMYGELCLRRIQGNWVMSFFDVAEYQCSALTVPEITDDWSKANRIDYATGIDLPQLYGGYITPDSVLNKEDGMRFLVSQWVTVDNSRYHVVAFDGTLQAQGELVEPTTPPEVSTMGEKVIDYDSAIVPQETGWWCGPAATQIVLNGMGIVQSEAGIAAAIEEIEHPGRPDDKDGTDYIGEIETYLDAQVPNARYTTVNMAQDPPSKAEEAKLWDNMRSSIDTGNGVVMNWVVPPSNRPRGIKGSESPSYGATTTYHYVAAMGYDDAYPGGAVWVADSGFRPFGYWITLHQCATLIPPKGYCYAAGKPVTPPVEPGEVPGQPEAPTDVQALYELLLRELSASGSTPITTPEGVRITLREAIEEIFWKERGPHGLSGRPRHPNITDDQLGHVLSMRAESLFTQALTYELAKRAGVDVAAIYAAVQRSLK